MRTCQYDSFLLPLSYGISRYEVFSDVFTFVSFALGKNTAYLTGCFFFFLIFIIIQKGVVTIVFKFRVSKKATRSPYTMCSIIHSGICCYLSSSYVAS